MDNVTKAQRSYIMSRIRSESSIEVLPEGLKGLYLRKHPKGVYGRPDFGNVARRIALFIDGDWWHGRLKLPKSNVAFWREKFRRNRLRDRRVNRKLLLKGWKVIRLWESELKADKKGGTKNGRANI
ncbi:MAG: very short patch repair endonuclease [Omnitrophica bacterium]|nr:very short patch repair endonuclease [Candidatus Omnitrophota bacterium]